MSYFHTELGLLTNSDAWNKLPSVADEKAATPSSSDAIHQIAMSFLKTEAGTTPTFQEFAAKVVEWIGSNADTITQEDMDSLIQLNSIFSNRLPQDDKSVTALKGFRDIASQSCEQAQRSWQGMNGSDRHAAVEAQELERNGLYSTQGFLNSCYHKDPFYQKDIKHFIEILAPVFGGGAKELLSSLDQVATLWIESDGQHCEIDRPDLPNAFDELHGTNTETRNSFCRELDEARLFLKSFQMTQISPASICSQMSSIPALPKFQVKLERLGCLDKLIHELEILRTFPMKWKCVSAHDHLLEEVLGEAAKTIPKDVKTLLLLSLITIQNQIKKIDQDDPKVRSQLEREKSSAITSALLSLGGAMPRFLFNPLCKKLLKKNPPDPIKDLDEEIAYQKERDKQKNAMNPHMSNIRNSRLIDLERLRAIEMQEPRKKYTQAMHSVWGKTTDQMLETLIKHHNIQQYFPFIKARIWSSNALKEYSATLSERRRDKELQKTQVESLETALSNMFNEDVGAARRMGQEVVTVPAYMHFLEQFEQFVRGAAIPDSLVKVNFTKWLGDEMAKIS